MSSSKEPVFDPFQVFEVSHRQAVTVHVKVTRGRRITKGWAADLVDTPDPYLILTLANSPNCWRKTSVKDNDINPTWDETFTFWLDPEQEHTLEMSLMDANYMVDEHLATRALPLNPLPIGKKLKKTINFNETSEIDFEIWGEQPNDQSDLRFSLMLCKDEKNFLEVRRRKICKTMKQHFGFAAPRTFKEVPVIGIIGSGGGFRAMTAYSGVMSALSELGVLDMATYVGGLSGSSWYLSQLYSHPEWPHISPSDQRDEIKRNIDTSFLWLFKSHGLSFAREVWKKRNRGEPVSFTDLFGHLVGNTLLKSRLGCKLSGQRQAVDSGLCPLPLYTCLHVKKCVSAMIFHEWMEFTPYEVGLPKYGTFMKSEQFACKFFLGNIVRRFPEPPLHFLMGIWGSAFCIQFKRLLQDDKNVDSKELMRREREELQEELERDMQKMDEGDSESSDEEGDNAKNEKGTGEKTTGGLQRKRSKSTKLKQKTFWESMLTRMMESSWFQSIELRAAQMFNFMRGLSLNHMFPISPFTQTQEEEEENNKDTFEGIFDLHPTHIKKLYVVDSGLTFNSPYPVILRPQREVDLILSFDFTARPSDDTPQPFKELLLAEKWAELNKVPFPPIDPTVVEREGLKECYVFKHPWDPNCPIVVHFCLVNINFRRETKPGVLRSTQEELDFGNFSLFDDPNRPYSTFKFTYTHQEFERLSHLMEYNTLLCRETIFDCISTCIKRRRRFSIRRPCKKTDISRLSLNSKIKAEKLLDYIKMVERINSQNNKNGKDHTDSGSPKLGKPRPISSPVNIPACEDNGEQEQEEVKNTKLNRSAVSLRSNPLRQRPDKSEPTHIMDGLTEESEDPDSGSDTSRPRTNSKPSLSRSKPVSMSMKATFDASAKKIVRAETPPDSPEPKVNDEFHVNSRSSSDAPRTHRAKMKLKQMDSGGLGILKEESVDLPGAFTGNGAASADSCTSLNGHGAVPDIVVQPLEQWIDAEERVTDL